MEFDQVQIQILRKDVLPSLIEVFSLIRTEESRRNMMVDNHVSENSALVTTNSGKAATGKVMNVVTGNKKIEEVKRECVWCTYYKRPRHTKDTCWKLHKKLEIASQSGNSKTFQ